MDCTGAYFPTAHSGLYAALTGDSANNGVVLASYLRRWRSIGSDPRRGRSAPRQMRNPFRLKPALQMVQHEFA
jgi:hypothetical protein